jgi:hypothetical protein
MNAQVWFGGRLEAARVRQCFAAWGRVDDGAQLFKAGTAARLPRCSLSSTAT